MNVKLRRIIFSIFLAIIFLGVTSVDAGVPTPYIKVSDEAFTKIEVRSEIINDFRPKPVPIKPTIPDLTAPVTIVKIQPKPKLSGGFTTGVASYYCLLGKSRCTVGHSGGMYAAIRKNMLFLRGKLVKVCNLSTKACIFVTIIDCNCGPNANLIDLYSDAFRKLRKIEMGTIKVSVSW